jgi:hypothetical protein
MKYLTKADLFERLKDVPDDTAILFNIQRYENQPEDNWDTFNVDISVDISVCPGYAGCTHTEPAIDCEVVFFVKWAEKRKMAEIADPKE